MRVVSDFSHLTRLDGYYCAVIKRIPKRNHESEGILEIDILHVRHHPGHSHRKFLNRSKLCVSSLQKLDTNGFLMSSEI